MSEFIDWQISAREMIVLRTIDKYVVNMFIRYADEITRKGKLASPNADETASFLITFSPEFIGDIMMCNTLPNAVERGYQRILLAYVKMAGTILVTAPDEFVAAIEGIISVPRAPFYMITPGETQKQDPVNFAVNAAAFAQSPILDALRKGITERTPIAKVRRLATLMLPVRDYFSLEGRGDLCRLFDEWVYKTAMEVPLRDMTDVDYDATFGTLCMIAAETQTKQNMAEHRLRFGIRLAKSGILEKQLRGVNSVATVLNEVMVACHVLQQEGVLDYFLKEDIHHELVPSFALILKFMFARGFARERELALFWEMAIVQHQSAIPVYMRAMVDIVTELPLGVFADIIDKSNKFTPASLSILRRIAVKCPDNERRKIFQRLWKALFDETDSDGSNTKLENIATMCAFLPLHDDKFNETVRTQCIDMIEKGDRREIALNVLKRSFRDMSAADAQTCFDQFIARITGDTLDYLEIVVQVLSRWECALTNEVFSKVRDAMEPLLKENPLKICSFYRSLLCCVTPTRVVILTKDMMVEVFKQVCSLDRDAYDDELISIVRMMHKFLIRYEDVDTYTIEYLWNVMSVTGNENIMEDLICYYTNNGADRMESFMKMSFERLTSPAVLSAIKKIIIAVEDGSERQMNQFFFDSDYYKVDLRGDRVCEVSVLCTISYHGLVRVIADKFVVAPRDIMLMHGVVRVDQSNFGELFTDNVTFKLSIQQDEGVQNFARPRQTPSQTLSEPERVQQLIELLNAGDSALSVIGLDIVNLMPTIDELVLEEFNASEFFDLNAPFMIIYKLHTLANKLRACPDFAAAAMGVTGLTALVNFTIESAAELFRDFPRILQFCFAVTTWIMELSVLDDIRLEVMTATSHTIAHVLALVQECDDDAVLTEIMKLLAHFGAPVADQEAFDSVVRATIFSSEPSVRQSVSTIVRSMRNDASRKALIIKQLERAQNSKCECFFSLLADDAERDDDPKTLWDVLVQCLYDNFASSKTDDVMTRLMFRPPKREFTNGIFRCLKLLCPRVSQVDDIDTLFDFLTTEIMFNELTFYEPTEDMFDFYADIVRKAPALIERLLKKFEMIREDRLTSQIGGRLSSEVVNRGIKNMGATCYINSTIQQLFNVPEFRDAVLSCTADGDDWFSEFVLIFGKLAVFPSSYINISGFIGKWKGSDNMPINPRVQEDAVEFLELLLERLEERVPHITDVFKGSIKYVSVNADDETRIDVRNESFLTFPLSVSGHCNTDQSFKSFLQPERMSKMIDGKSVPILRYDEISEAPAVLILQLKRFSYDIERRERLKINSKFEFPMQLELDEVTKSDTKYDLCGVVLHSGTAGAGHYVSNVKRSDSKKHWLRANDMVISKMSSASVCEGAAGGKKTIHIFEEGTGEVSECSFDNSDNGYLLFYRKKTTEDAKEDRGISINADLLSQLVKEIKEMIITEKMSSPVFFSFVGKVSGYDSTGQLMYEYVANEIRVRPTACGTFDAVRHLCHTCENSMGLCETVLSKKDDFNGLLVASLDEAGRSYFSMIVKSALEHGNDAAKVKFAQTIYIPIINDTEMLMTYLACFEQLFALYSFTVNITDEKERIESARRLTKILCSDIPEYQMNYGFDDFYSLINLTSLMASIRRLMSDEKSLSKLGKVFFASELFTDIWIAPHHHNALMDLVSHILTHAVSTAEVLRRAVSSSDNIPVSMLGSLFRVALTVDNVTSQLRDCFFERIDKKSTSVNEHAEFLSSLESLPKSAVSRFVSTSRKWILGYLISPMSTKQKVMGRIILSTTASPEEQIMDISSYVELILSGLRPLLQVLRDMVGKLKANTVHPTRNFFETLTQLITVVPIEARTPPMVNGCVEALNFLKSVADYRMSEDVPHVLDFLSKIYGRSIFEHIKLNKLLSWLSNLNFGASTSRLIISLTPASEASTLLSSNAFDKICVTGLGNPVLRGMILSGTTDDTMKHVSEGLWTVSCFEHVLHAGNVEALEMFWLFMRRFPKSTLLFEKTELYVSLFRTFVNGSTHKRQIAKLLAVFTRVYGELVEGKWDILAMCKKTEAVVGRYRDGGFRVKNVMNDMLSAPQTPPPGNDGIVDFVKAVCDIDQGVRKDTLDLLASQSRPVFPRVRPSRAAVSFFCSIWHHARNDKANSFILREFQAIGELYETVDMFCKWFNLTKDVQFWKQLKPLLYDILVHAETLDVFGDHVATSVCCHFNPDEAMKVYDRLSRAVENTIRWSTGSLGSIDGLITLGIAFSRAYAVALKIGPSFELGRLSVAPLQESTPLIASLMANPETETYAVTLESLINTTI